MDVVGKKIKSLKKLEKREDVFCLGAIRNGTMIANGIITKNCDALRYAIRSFMKGRTTLRGPNNDDPDFGRNLGRPRGEQIQQQQYGQQRLMI